jgi:hypothetical protein
MNVHCICAVTWNASGSDRSVVINGPNSDCPAHGYVAAERLAKEFHETYERLAEIYERLVPVHGYETRKASAKLRKDVPAENRDLMIATCRSLLLKGVINLADVVEHDCEAT